MNLIESSDYVIDEQAVFFKTEIEIQQLSTCSSLVELVESGKTNIDFNWA